MGRTQVQQVREIGVQDAVLLDWVVLPVPCHESRWGEGERGDSVLGVSGYELPQRQVLCVHTDSQGT